MFCPNCSADIPDGSTFCGCCGHKMTQPEPQHYTPSAATAYPGYTTYTSYARPMNNMTKKEFLSSDAGHAAKAMSRLAVLVGLIAVGVIIAGIFATLTMPFYQVPVMSVLFSAAGEDIEGDVDELSEELEGYLDEMEDEYEMLEDELSDSELEIVEDWMDATADIVDSFSALNLYNFAVESEVVADELGDVFEMGDMGDFSENMEYLNQIAGIIIVILAAFFFLPILFTLLGGTLKNTPLTIIGMIFTAISQVIFCGVMWVVLSLVIGIVQCTLCIKVNSAYRDYRMGRASV